MALDLRDPRTQKVLLASLLAVGLVYVFYNYFYTPSRERVAELRTHLESLTLYHGGSRAFLAKHDLQRLEREKAELEARLRAWERLLIQPEDRSQLLGAVAQEAMRAAVELGLFKPLPAQPGKEFLEQPFQLGVQGDYHQIGVFLSLLTNLPMLVRPSQLDLRARPPASPGGSVEAVFQLSIYLPPPTVERGSVAPAGAPAGLPAEPAPAEPSVSGLELVGVARAEAVLPAGVKPELPADTPLLVKQLDGYAVQVGAFSARWRAESLVRSLEGHGLVARIQPVHHPSLGPLFRVRLGPFGTREEGAGLVRRLRQGVASE